LLTVRPDRAKEIVPFNNHFANELCQILKSCSALQAVRGRPILNLGQRGKHHSSQQRAGRVANLNRKAPVLARAVINWGGQ
jgi:hypothetical protein